MADRSIRIRLLPLVDPAMLRRAAQQVETSMKKATTAAQQAATKALAPLKQMLQEFRQQPLTMRLLGVEAFLSVSQRVTSALSTVFEAGQQFEQALARVQAITGVTGEKLEGLGQRARQLAQEFGGSASAYLDSFVQLLSRLGPQIASQPEALERMARSVATLSAAAGINAQQAVDALTTAVLQFGVSLDDPAAAAEKMEEMLNVMAAGAKEGAAEIPQIAAALKVAGVAAKQTGVSFAEANAALQVLAKGGKEGAEAGTALRNVLSRLAEIEFIPEDAQKALLTAGVDMQKLADATVPLSEKLRILQQAQLDIAQVTQIFGVENAAAAQILIQGADAVASLGQAITGTKTAFEQAQIMQNTTAAAIERFRAQVENAMISLYDFAGKAVVQVVQGGAQLGQMFSGLAGAMAVLPMDRLSGALRLVKGQFARLAPAVRAAWAAMTGPVGLAVAAVAALGAVIYKIVVATEEGAKAFRNIGIVIQTVVENALGLLGKLADALVTALNPANWFSGEAQQALGELGKAITEVVDAAQQRIGQADFAGAIKQSLSALEQYKVGLKVQADTRQVQQQVEQLQQQIQQVVEKGADTATLQQLSQQTEQLAQQFPNAVAGVHLLRNESGELVKVYEISAEKVKQLQQQMLKVEQVKMDRAARKMNNALFEASQLLQSQQNQLQQLQQQLQQAAKAGKIQEVEQLMGRYNELQQQIKQNSQQLQDAMQKAYAKGVVTSEVIAAFAKAYNMSTKEAKELLAVQAEQVEKAEALRQSTQELVKGFQQLQRQAKQNLDKVLTELAALEYQRRLRGKLTEAEQKRRRELIQQGRLYAQQTQSIEKAQQAAKQLLGLEQQRSRVQKSASQQRFKAIEQQLQQLRKRNESQLQQLRYAAEIAALEKGRTLSAAEELAIAQKRLEARRKELEFLKQQQANIKLSIDERKELESLIEQANAAVQQAERDVQKLKIKVQVDQQQLQQQIAQLQFDRLRWEVEIGIRNRSELVAQMQQQLQQLQQQLQQATGKKAVEIQRKIFDIERQIYDERKKLAEQAAEDQMMQLRKQQQAFERYADTVRQVLQTVFAARGSAADADYQRQLDELERLRNQQLISEEQYQRRREELERQHQQRLQEIQQMQAGAEKRRQQIEEVAAINIKMQRLLAQRNALLQQGLEQEAELLNQQIEQLAGQLQQRTSVLSEIAKIGGENLATALSALFAGVPEQSRDALRAGLQQLAGYLQELASGVIMKLVIEQLSITPGGFAALVLIPVLQAVVRSAIAAILNPVLQSLRSFQSGGIATEPTIAIVGDAAGVDQTEFILRSDQLAKVIQKAASQLTPSEHRFAAALASQLGSVEFRLRGTDLVGTIRRVRAWEQAGI